MKNPLNYNIDLMKSIEGKDIVITGATGVVGYTLIKSLLNYKLEQSSSIEIYGLARNKKKFEELYIQEEVKPIFHSYDMMEEIDLNLENPIIIHAASPTDTQFFLKKPLETITQTVESVRNILSFAKRTKASNLVYLSSLEIYGEPKDATKPLIESTFFGLDTLNPRNSYALAKMIAENLIYSAYQHDHISITILRLAQVIAPPLNKDDNRVIVQFAKNVMNGETIVLRTKGNTIRNYCDYRELTDALFTAIVKGKPGDVYNVGSHLNICSILEIAETFSAISEGKTVVNFDIDHDNMTGYRDNIYLAIDSTKIRDLGWHPKYTLHDSLSHLVAVMGSKKTYK